MERLTEIARSLNRPLPVIRALQAKMGLPVLRGDRYPPAYVILLRKMMALRRLGVSEERIARLFELEQKLMRLLNADALDSETWFLDFVMQVGDKSRRLLLTNFDVGCDLETRAVQPGLALAGREKELFKAGQGGEDAMRMLVKYLGEYHAVIQVIAGELALLRGALAWGKKLAAGIPGDEKAHAKPARRRGKRENRRSSGQMLPGMA